jgi:FtsH-binding integral membrane protein
MQYNQYNDPYNRYNPYQGRFEVVAAAAQNERAAFIRRTYGHLAGAVLAFVALEALLLRIPGIEKFAGALVGGGWLVVFLAFWGVSVLASYWARSETSVTLQYAGLALYTAAEAVIFLPLMYVAQHFYPHAIQTAGILTTCVFVGLTVTVFLTRRDFTFLAPVLTVGSLLALGFIIASILFGFSLGLVFCFAMVALLTGFILYNTSAVLFHYRTDQHVAASLALFSSVATLFWYILQIVMLSGRD